VKCWLHNQDREPKRYSNLVIIFGDGRCLLDDIRAMVELGFDKLTFDRFSIARSYQKLGNITHWGDVDGETSIWWAQNGKFPWRNGKPQRHTLGEVQGFDFDWNTDQASYDARPEKFYGSSALFAVLVSLAMGYEQVILAGCPLDENGHWYALPDQNGPIWDAEDFMAWEDFVQQEEANRVRSLSGITAEILKMPDNGWLMENEK